jgi:hypothetical protein
MVTFAEPPSLKEETTNYNQESAGFRSSESWKTKKATDTCNNCGSLIYHKPAHVPEGTLFRCQLSEVRNFIPELEEL